MLKEGFDEGSWTPAIVESEGLEITYLLWNACEIAGRNLGEVIQRCSGERVSRARNGVRV